MSTKFTSLGAKLVEVALSPSTPLYTRRSSLLATFGPKDQVVIQAPTVRSPGLLYQKIISNTPLKALISTQSPSSELSVLKLDGTIDWMISRSHSLHTYWGDSLVVSSKRSWLRPFGKRPLLLSGRGLAALQSVAGPIQTVNIEDGQSIVINRNSLLAYSVDSNLGLRVSSLNSTVQYNSSAKKDTELPSTRAKQVWSLIKSAFSWFKSDKSQYQRVNGPTTIYITAPAAPSWIPTSITAKLGGFTSPNQSPLEIAAHKQAAELVSQMTFEKQQAENAGLRGPPENHLKIATVVDGKVQFVSTSTFKNM